MTLGTDVRIDEVDITFTDIRLATPLKLATATIETITRADVRCLVSRPDGTCAVGEGSATLSPIWAWGRRCPPVAAADSAMRDALVAVGGAMRGSGRADPFQHADRMQAEVTLATDKVRLAAGLEPVPALVGDVCVAALDAATHDGWGRARGVSCYDLYAAGQMHGDLAAVFGPAMRRRTMAEAVQRPPRGRLPVSWLVGAGDDPVSSGHELGQRQAKWIKAKVRCEDPAADAQWLVALHRSATGALGRHQNS